MIKTSTLRNLCLLFFSGLSLSSFGQVANPDYFSSADFVSPGTTLQGSAAALTASDNSKIIVTSAKLPGTCNFNFYSALSGGTKFSPSTVTPVSFGTAVTLGGGGPANYTLSAANTTDNFIFKTNNVLSTPKLVVFKISGPIVNIATVLQNPAQSAVCSGASTTVNTILSSALGPDQGAYLWWTTDGFATKNVVAMTGSGNNYNGTLPAFAAGTNVSYKVITSGAGIPIAGSDVELYTINSSGAPVNFVVNGPPVITAQPVAYTVCANGTAGFSVVASGSGLTYQWQEKIGAGSFTNISNGGIYSGANSPNLSLANVPAGMSNNSYQCIVMNACSASVTSNYAFLTVTPVPSISINPAATSICPGGVATLNASGQATTYSWSPGTTLSNTTTATTTASPTATTTYNVIGTYNGCSNTASVTVSVNTAPTIVTQPMNVTICGTGNAVFTTAASGTSLNYQWQEKVGASAFGNITDGGMYSGTTTNSLTLTNPAAPFSGNQYQCIVNGVCTPFATSNPALLTIYASLSAGTIGSSQSICYNSTVTLSETTAASGGPGSYTYQWAASPDNISFTDITGATQSNFSSAGLKSNVYFRRTVFSGGCTPQSSNAVLITVYGNLTGGTIGSAQTICYNAIPAALNESAVATGGPGSYTYQWESSPDNVTFTPVTGANTLNYTPAALTANTYYRRNVTSGACGSAYSNVILITVNPNPVVSVSPSNFNLCAGGSLGLTASGASSYVWSPAASLSSSTTASTTATPATTTTYTVTGTSAAGCTTTATSTLTVTPYPSLTVTPVNPTICAGASTAFSASGATTYTWSPATGLSSTTIGNPVASPASSIAYTVTGWTNGCSSSASVSVTVNPAPTISGQPGNATICAGAATNFSVTASNGLTYQWQEKVGAAAFANISDGGVYSGTTTSKLSLTAVPTSMSANQYQCIVSGTCAPSATSSSATLTVNPSPTVTVSPANPNLCAGGSLGLTASGASSYVWSPAASLSSSTTASTTATPATTTTYTVTGTSTAGCTATATSTLTVTPYPALNISPNSPSICPGGSVNLSVTGATTYSWSPVIGLSSSTSPFTTASPSSTTAYTVTGINNGCSATMSVTVNVNNSPVITTQPTNATVCPGSTASFNISTSGTGLTFQWQEKVGAAAFANIKDGGIYSGATTSALSLSGISASMSTNQYQCIVSGTCSPITSSIANLTINSLNITATATNLNCNGEANANATANPTGGTTPYSYSWNTTPVQTNPIASGLGAGAYTITVTDAIGCSSTATATVIAPKALTTTTTITNPDCSGGNTGNASVTANGGTAPYTYSWNTSPVQTTANASGLGAGSYTVTVTDAKACNSNATVTIIMPVALSASTKTTNTSCNGTSNGSATATVSGGTAPYIYSIDGITFVSGNTFSNLSAGNYILTVKDANNCTSNATAVVIAPAPVVATIKADGPTALCIGNKVTLTSSPGSTYLWSDGTTSNAIVVSQVSGNYTVKVTDANGCANTSAITSVTVKPVPAANFTTSNSPSNLTLGAYVTAATSGLYYYFDFGDNSGAASSSTSHTYNAAGAYLVTLKVMDSTVVNCQNTSSQSVTVGTGGCTTAANFTFTQDTVKNTISFSDKSTGTVNGWYWDYKNGEFSTLQNPVYSFVTPGIHSVCLTVRDSIKGCQNSFCADGIKTGNTSNCEAKFNFFTDGTSNKILFSGSALNSSSSKFYWTFGNADYSTQQNPVYTYPTTGYYEVCLHTRDAITGCQSKACNFVHAGNGDCKALYSAVPSSTNPLNLNFVDASGGNPTAWHWDFGDGNVSNTHLTNHIFASSGYYNVCLTISNGTCQNTYCNTVHVGSGDCKTSFNYFDNPVKKVIEFKDQSWGNPSSWSWQFGDGYGSSLANPVHAYANNGAYSICLTTINAAGCISNSCETITIGNIGNDCQADFEVFENNNIATFKNKSVGDADTYFWDFGDQYTDVVKAPSHTYSADGYYFVSLTIYNKVSGCFNTTFKKVTIGTGAASLACEAKYSYIADSASKTVTFKDESFGKPVSWMWTFSDSTTSNVQHPKHTFKNPGFYQVCLVIKSANGSTNSYCSVVNIGKTGLAADFSFEKQGTFYYKTEAVYPVSFYGSAYGKPSKWKWAFGDANFDSLRINVTHNYINGGSYPACLTISDPVSNLVSNHCKVVKVGTILGLSENDASKADLKVYPNPITSQGIVSYYIENNAAVQLSLYDLQARKLRTFSNGQQVGAIHQAIDVSDLELSQGMYLIHLNINGKLIVQPVIVNK